MRFNEFNQLNEAADRVKWLVRRKAQIHGAGTTHATMTQPGKVEGWFYSQEEAEAKLHQLEQDAARRYEINKDLGLPMDEFEIEKTDLYGTPIREDELAEVAPPGMEDWIKDRKADFKKRYGDKWEQVLYATAWKRHKNESIKESHGEDSPVASAIIRRIMMQHSDLLQKYGPEKIMQAVDDQVAWVGDVEEIGTSDVSIWVKDVERSLADMNQEQGVEESSDNLSVGQMMAQDGIVYSPEREKEIIRMVPDYMKKAGYSSKDIRYYFNYDEDFIPDVLSDLPRSDEESENNSWGEQDHGLFGDDERMEEAALDPSGLIAAAEMVQDYIVTAEVDGKTKKFRVRGMTGPNAAKERFLKHASMAKVIDVKPEQGVAEGSEEKEEFKPWGTLKKPQPYHDPDWMKKIPQKELDGLAGRNKKTKNKDVAEADDKFSGHEQAEWDEKMARLKKLAGQGELKTVWDPVKRVYKNVPVNQDKE